MNNTVQNATPLATIMIENRAQDNTAGAQGAEERKRRGSTPACFPRRVSWRHPQIGRESGRERVSSVE
jgi:hypothetical protein